MMVFWEAMNSRREDLNEAENLARNEMASDVNGVRRASAVKKSNAVSEVNAAELIKTKNVAALVKAEIFNRIVDEGHEDVDKQDRSFTP